MKKYYMKVVFIILISIVYIILGYSKSNAAKLNGWVTLNSNKYYYVNDKPVKGKYKVTQAPKGVFYFSEKDGKMLSGWRTINSKKYYFTEKSGMVTGYNIINNKGYYFDTNGIMKNIIKGYKIINGKGYYFDSNGTMVRNKTIKGIKYNSNGTCDDLVKYKMAMKANSQTSNTKNLILIDYTKYNIALFTGSKGNWTLKAFGKCSYGRNAERRLGLGDYTLGKKYDNNIGELYVNFKNNSGQPVSGYVYYTVQLLKNNKATGRYIHTTLYAQKLSKAPGTYDSAQLGKRNTNGCIRANLAISKTIFNTYKQGTKVCIYKS